MSTERSCLHSLHAQVCQKQAEASAQGRDLAQSCKDFLQQVRLHGPRPMHFNSFSKHT